MIDDPVQKTFKESPDFNNIWLGRHSKQTTVQSLGFAWLSTVIGAGGTTFLGIGLGRLRNEDPMSVFFLIGGAIFTYFGGLGLLRVAQNVFFKRRGDKQAGPS